MGKRTEIKYQPGDLVRWYERYADGFMVRDVGEGIVIERRDYNLQYMNTPYVNYMVYRTKHCDKMIFEEVELERIDKNE